MELKLTTLLLFSLLFTANVSLTAEMEDRNPKNSSKQEAEYTPMQDETPIIDAINNKDPLDVIKKIVSAHHDRIDETDNNGNTPLILASRLGDENLVGLLLKYGPNTEHRNSKNESAINVAEKNNRIKRLLVVKTPLLGYLPPILKAIKNKKPLEQIERLITEYDIDQTGPYQSTALMFATYFGDEEKTRFVLKKCNNINARNEDGLTALNFASNQQIRALLKSHGAVFGENTEQSKFAPNQSKNKVATPDVPTTPIDQAVTKFLADVKKAKLTNNELRDLKLTAYEIEKHLETKKKRKKSYSAAQQKEPVPSPSKKQRSKKTTEQ